MLGALVVYLLNPFAGGQTDTAEAFARALTQVEASGAILHERTTTRIVNGRGPVDLARPLTRGQLVESESWSTPDGYLKERDVGRLVGVYTATPTEHSSYLSSQHRIVVSRWASSAERAAFLRGHRAFSPAAFLAAYHRGLVRFVGRTGWEGRPALRFRYAGGYSILVDPRTYHPLVYSGSYHGRQRAVAPLHAARWNARGAGRSTRVNPPLAGRASGRARPASGSAALPGSTGTGST